MVPAVTELLALLPIQSVDLRGHEIRCHELARAVLDAVRAQLTWRYIRPSWLSVIDGTYAQVDHSWIDMVIPTTFVRGRAFGTEPTAADYRSKSRVILDPYAVGSLPQVRLLDCSSILAGSWGLYEPGPVREDIREDVVDLLLWSMRANRFDVAADEASRVPVPT